MKNLILSLLALTSSAAFAQSSGGTAIQCFQDGIATPVIDYDYSWENGEMNATTLKIHFGDENDEFSWENWKFQQKQDPGGYDENINLDPTPAPTSQEFISYEQPGRGIYLLVDRHDIVETPDPSGNDDRYVNTYTFPAVIERAENLEQKQTPVKCTASERMHGG